MTLCPATKGHCECQPEVSVYCPENLYIAYLQAEVAALRRQIMMSDDAVRDAYVEMCSLLYDYVQPGEDEVECLRRLLGQSAIEPRGCPTPGACSCPGFAARKP